jgi:hypothetical protein
MKYPAYTYNSSPTPSEELEVCDKCQQAFWTIYISNQISYCSCGSRKRRATKKEKLIAIEFLAVNTLNKIFFKESV